MLSIRLLKNPIKTMIAIVARYGFKKGKSFGIPKKGSDIFSLGL